MNTSSRRRWTGLRLVGVQTYISSAHRAYELADALATPRREGRARRSASDEPVAHNADLWIAATAIRWRIPLVAHDAIFDGCPGLDSSTELDTPASPPTEPTQSDQPKPGLGLQWRRPGERRNPMKHDPEHHLSVTPRWIELQQPLGLQLSVPNPTPSDTSPAPRLRRPGSGRSCPMDSILTYLEAIGEIRRIAGEPERWAP